MSPLQRVLTAAVIVLSGCRTPTETPRTPVAARPEAPSVQPGPAPGPHLTELALGNSFSCALVSDGTVRCWGANHEGQLGDGTRLPRRLPVSVLGLTDAI